MASFERLRALVRWSGDDERELAEQAAALLRTFGSDPVGLVTACRQIVAHHRENPYVWWLGARVLAAADGPAAAGEAANALTQDHTGSHLVAALPFPTDDPVLALGHVEDVHDDLDSRFDLDLRTIHDPEEEADGVDAPVAYALVVPDVVTTNAAEVPADVAAVVRSLPATTRIWLIVPTGRALPRALYDARRMAIRPRASSDRFGPGPAFADEPGPGAPTTVELDLALVDRLICARGRLPAGDLPRLVDAPVAPELLRTLG